MLTHSFTQSLPEFLPLVAAVQSLGRVRLSVTPWTTARQACLSFIISQILLKLMSIESVMPSNQLILCHPLVLLLSIFPCIRVFTSELPMIAQLVKNPPVMQETLV